MEAGTERGRGGRREGKRKRMRKGMRESVNLGEKSAEAMGGKEGRKYEFI